PLTGPSTHKSDNTHTSLLIFTNDDQTTVNAGELPILGAHGLVRPTANALQVVIGTQADQIAGEIRGALPAASATRAGAGADATCSWVRPRPRWQARSGSCWG